MRGALEVALGQARARGPGHGALAAAGEDQPVPLPGDPRQLGETVAGCGLLPAAQVGAGDRGGEAAVPGLVPHQHQQVLPLGVGRSGAGCGDHGGAARGLGPGLEAEGQLGAEHGRDPRLGRGLRRLHHTGQPVVVHQRDRAEPEPGRLDGHVLGARGAVEEAEVGVGVQLRVLDVTGRTVRILRLLPGVLDDDRRGDQLGRTVREDRLEVLPRGRAQEPAGHGQTPRAAAPSCSARAALLATSASASPTLAAS